MDDQVHYLLSHRCTCISVGVDICISARPSLKLGSNPSSLNEDTCRAIHWLLRSKLQNRFEIMMSERENKLNISLLAYSSAQIDIEHVHVIEHSLAGLYFGLFLTQELSDRWYIKNPSRDCWYRSNLTSRTSSSAKTAALIGPDWLFLLHWQMPEVLLIGLAVALWIWCWRCNEVEVWWEDPWL